MTDAGSPAPPPDRTPAAAAPSGPVIAWVWGGGLLIGSALLQLAMMAGIDAITGARQVGYWAGVVVFAAAMIVFAWGLKARGSVVDRRPAGMIALCVLAAWPFIDGAVSLLLPQGQTAAELAAYGVWATIAWVIWVAAAALAVIEIARARVVPGVWRWAPLWALAVVIGSYALTQIVAVAVGWQGVQVITGLLQLQGMVTVVVPVALGIIAIVLGLTPRPAVQVYPSA